MAGTDEIPRSASPSIRRPRSGGPASSSSCSAARRDAAQRAPPPPGRQWRGSPTSSTTRWSASAFVPASSATSPAGPCSGYTARSRSASLPPHFSRGSDRAHVGKRQQKRKRAALARLAMELEPAAEQPRELPANGKPEAGAAVLPARRPIGLLERLEDHVLLVRRNTDAGVFDGEGDEIGPARVDA